MRAPRSLVALRSCLLALWVVVPTVGLAVCARRAHADSGFLLPAPGHESTARPARLLAESCDLRIEAPHFQASVEQTFEGLSRRVMDCQYVLPLAPAERWEDIRLLQGDEARPGRLLRGQAARDWLRARMVATRRRDLGRWWHHDVFVADVGSLEAGDRPRFLLKKSRRIDGSPPFASHVVASIGETTRAAEPATLRLVVRVVSPSPTASNASTDTIGMIWCPTHPLAFVVVDARTKAATWEGPLAAERDRVALAWGPGGALLSSLLVSRWSEERDSGTFALFLESGPEVGPGLRTGVRVLSIAIDASASMAGRRWLQVQAAVAAAIEALGPMDRVQLVVCGERAESLYDAPRPASIAVAREAREFLRRMHPRGGCDIAGGLVMALGAARTHHTPLQVLFVSDGRPTAGLMDPVAIADVVERSLGTPPARILPVAVGMDVDTRLLHRIARLGGSTPSFVKPREPLGPTLAKCFQTLARTWLWEAAVDLSSMDPSEVAPDADRLPDLVAGTRTVVTGRYREGGRQEIVVSGKSDEQSRQHGSMHFATKSGQGMPGGHVERLWAWQRLATLVDDLRLGTGPAEVAEPLLDELILLGARYGLPTEYTLSLADPAAPLPGDVAGHRRRARAALASVGGARARAGEWAHALGNEMRRGAERAPEARVPLVVAAPDDRQTDVVVVSGVRHIGAQAFFQRDGDGWVEGTVADGVEAVSLEPGTAAFDAWLAALDAERADVLMLEGPILLEFGGTVHRIEVWR